MINSIRVRRWAAALCVAGAAISIDTGPAMAGGLGEAPGPATPAPSVVTLPPSRVPVQILPSHPDAVTHTLRFSPVPGRYSVETRPRRVILVVLAAAGLLLVVLIAGAGLAVRAWLPRR